MVETVAVIGAGPVGSLMALGLAHRGYDVTLFDSRPDPRTIQNKNLRSINLAVSARGITAMEFIDPEMKQRILEDIIPMHGRMIHDLTGNEESQIYGLFGESINSIDRGKLNEDLIDEIVRFNDKKNKAQIKLKFNSKIGRINFDADGKVQITDNDSFDFIIGADGSYSNIRYQMQKNIRMDYKQEYVDMCYLELYIPPTPTGFAIDPNHLHIWPRKDFMLIALANSDGSFTSTFFGPWKLTEELDTPDKIEPFFREQFPDAVNLIGIENVIDVFMNNPKGALMQVTCSKYNYSDKCIIIGDAAHSMVPFYGQGMNCGFEDVKILLELFDTCKTRKETFDKYSEVRQKDLQAILKLAWDNYHEMSTKVMSQLYLFRKTLDGVLGRIIPQYWVPMYSMVSFRHDIPYSQCISREKRQTLILKAIELGALSAIGLAALFKFKKS
ncbi:kynurenine 3-monooxygenase [Martiniozyma asiatica (nom. inval.)]|nr:kynurenine 3-monooxygenase [Martiniozyma asiatica]